VLPTLDGSFRPAKKNSAAMGKNPALHVYIRTNTFCAKVSKFFFKFWYQVFLWRKKEKQLFKAGLFSTLFVKTWQQIFLALFKFSSRIFGRLVLALSL
jgi:hypothetical protein